jgi:hypothetical protein
MKYKILILFLINMFLFSRCVVSHQQPYAARKDLITSEKYIYGMAKTPYKPSKTIRNLEKKNHKKGKKIKRRY